VAGAKEDTVFHLGGRHLASSTILLMNADSRWPRCISYRGYLGHFERYLAGVGLSKLGDLASPMLTAFIAERGQRYGLGLRVREVARLRVEHIDWDRNVLFINETKFFKSRLIPFGPKMGAQLREYLAKRTELVGPLAPSDPVFSFGNDKSREINPYTVTQTFQQL